MRFQVCSCGQLFKWRKRHCCYDCAVREKVSKHYDKLLLSIRRKNLRFKVKRPDWLDDPS